MKMNEKFIKLKRLESWSAPSNSPLSMAQDGVRLYSLILVMGKSGLVLLNLCLKGIWGLTCNCNFVLVNSIKLLVIVISILNSSLLRWVLIFIVVGHILSVPALAWLWVPWNFWSYGRSHLPSLVLRWVNHGSVVDVLWYVGLLEGGHELARLFLVLVHAFLYVFIKFVRFFGWNALQQSPNKNHGRSCADAASPLLPGHLLVLENTRQVDLESNVGKSCAE